jgi:hypothetical protein
MKSGRKMRVKAAQRILHGTVRVLLSLRGMEVRNLRPDFDASYYKLRSDAIDACKALCYSDIACNYWTYSTSDGCFVEDPPMHQVAYPLTRDDINHHSDFARSVVAGEYILHRCPENDGTFTTADEHAKFTMLPWEWNWSAFHMPWDEGGWPWWGWLLFSIAACCCCGCMLVLCGCCGLCVVLRDKLRGGAKTAPKGDHSDEESSSSSSDSETERRGNAQKKALLHG